MSLPEPVDLAVVLHEKIMLLSSAVADADNLHITNSKKLLMLSAIEQLIPRLPKSEIVLVQRKLEELCMHTMGQSPPALLKRPISGVLLQLFKYGDGGGMHFTINNLIHSESKDIHENSVRLSVAVALVSSRGSSLAHLLPDFLSNISKLAKSPEPAAREEAVNLLSDLLVELFPTPPSNPPNSLQDTWKFLFVKIGDRSPQVRMAACRGLGVLSRCAPEIAALNAEGSLGPLLKVVVLSFDSGTSFPPSLILEARSTFASTLALVLVALVISPLPPRLPIKDLSSACAWLAALCCKYPESVDSLSTILVRFGILLSDYYSKKGESETGGLVLVKVAKTLIGEISEISVNASSYGVRALMRQAGGDASILKFIEAVVLPVLQTGLGKPTDQNWNENALLVALDCFTEATGLVDASVGSVMSPSGLMEKIPHASDKLLTRLSFALRGMIRVRPAEAMRLVNMFLNLVTVNHAEFEGTAGSKDSSVGSRNAFLKVIRGNAVGLASVLAEGGWGNDVVGGVIAAASAMISPETEDTSYSLATMRQSGFIILESVMGAGAEVLGGRLIGLFALWKCVLGKRALGIPESGESARTSIVSGRPGSPPITDWAVVGAKEVIDVALNIAGGVGEAVGGAYGKIVGNSINPNTQSHQSHDQGFASLLAVYHALRSLKKFIISVKPANLLSPTLSVQPRLIRVVVMLLGNAWQAVAGLPAPVAPIGSAGIFSSTGIGQLGKNATAESELTTQDVVFLIKGEICASLQNLEISSIKESLPETFCSGLLSALLADLEGSSNLSPVAFFREISSANLTSTDLADPIADEIVNASVAGIADSALVFSLNEYSGKTHIPPLDYMASSLPFKGEGGKRKSSIPAANVEIVFPFDDKVFSGVPISLQGHAPRWFWRNAAVILLPKLLGGAEGIEDGRVISDVMIKYLESATPVENTKKTDFGKNLEISTILGSVLLLFLRSSKKPPSPLLVDRFLASSDSILSNSHPLTRRVHGCLMGAFLAGTGNSKIFEDLAMNSDPRKRAVAAIVATEAVSIDLGLLPSVIPSLLKLAKETTQPVRVCVLRSLAMIMEISRDTFEPFLRETVRLLYAHALADVYYAPNVLAAISRVVVAGGGVGETQTTSGALWGEMARLNLEIPSVYHLEIAKCVCGFVGRAIGKKSALSNPSTPSMTRRGSFVLFGSSADLLDTLGPDFLWSKTQETFAFTESRRAAICALSSATSGRENSDEISRLARLYDRHPECRDVIGELFLTLAANQTISRLISIAQGGSRRQEPAIERRAALGGIQSEKVSQGQSDEEAEDDDEEEGQVGGLKLGLTKPGSVSRKNSVDIAVSQEPLGLPARGLVLKGLKRAVESAPDLEISIIPHLHSLISLACGAATGDHGSRILWKRGAKLLEVLLVRAGNFQVEGDDGMEPVLLQFEAEISAALRRGLRTGADSAFAIQMPLLEVCEAALLGGVSFASEKLAELVFAPLLTAGGWNESLKFLSSADQCTEKEASLLFFRRVRILGRVLRKIRNERRSTLYEFMFSNRESLYFHLVRCAVDCAMIVEKKLIPKTASQNTGVNAPGNFFSYAPFAFALGDLPLLRSSTRSVLLVGVVESLTWLHVLGWFDFSTPPQRYVPATAEEVLDVGGLFAGLVESLFTLDGSLEATSVGVWAVPAVIGVGSERKLCMRILRVAADRAIKGFLANKLNCEELASAVRNLLNYLVGSEVVGIVVPVSLIYKLAVQSECFSIVVVAWLNERGVFEKFPGATRPLLFNWKNSDNFSNIVTGIKNLSENTLPVASIMEIVKEGVLRLERISDVDTKCMQFISVLLPVVSAVVKRGYHEQGRYCVLIFGRTLNMINESTNSSSVCNALAKLISIGGERHLEISQPWTVSALSHSPPHFAPLTAALELPGTEKSRNFFYLVVIKTPPVWEIEAARALLKVAGYDRNRFRDEISRFQPDHRSEIERLLKVAVGQGVVAGSTENQIKLKMHF